VASLSLSLSLPTKERSSLRSAPRNASSTPRFSLSFPSRRRSLYRRRRCRTSAPFFEIAASCINAAAASTHLEKNGSDCDAFLYIAGFRRADVRCGDSAEATKTDRLCRIKCFFGDTRATFSSPMTEVESRLEKEKRFILKKKKFFLRKKQSNGFYSTGR